MLLLLWQKNKVPDRGCISSEISIRSYRKSEKDGEMTGCLETLQFSLIDVLWSPLLGANAKLAQVCLQELLQSLPKYSKIKLSIRKFPDADY